MADTTELLTWEQAQALTSERRVQAVSDVLARWLSGRDLSTAVAQVVAAYAAVDTVQPSDCPQVDPKFGQCVLDYGHDGPHFTTEYDDPRRPDGSHPWDF